MFEGLDRDAFAQAKEYDFYETERDNMNKNDITYDKVEQLQSELWSIGNMANDLEGELEEITTDDAAEKFNEIIEELRRLVEMFTEK